MYCKHCGKEISENAKFCDGCGKSAAEEPKKTVPAVDTDTKKNKKRHPVLGAIVLIFGVFILVGAFIGGSDEPKKVETNTSVTSAPVETTAPADFTVGDTVEMRDIYVTLNSFTENKGANFYVPNEGNVFVLCEFTIENKTNSDLAISSLLCFQAYADDFSTNMSITATLLSDKGQLDGTVAAGKKMNGVIGYEIPEDWNTFEVHFTPTAWSSSFEFVCTK